MHVVDIDAVDFDPTSLRYMVQVVDGTGHGISMSSMINGSLSKVNGLLQRQVVAVVRVQHTVSKCRSTSNRKHLALETSTIVIDIIQLWSGLIPAGDFGIFK